MYTIYPYGYKTQTEIVSNILTEIYIFFGKINHFEKYFAHKVNKTLDPVTQDEETHKCKRVRKCTSRVPW